MSKFKNILTFLGFNSDTQKVDLTDEQIGKIDAELGNLQGVTAERDGLKMKVTGLETAANADKARITELEGQLSTITGERDSANAKVVTLTAEVDRLGKLDAGAISNPNAIQDRHPDEEKIELSATQKELFEKAANM